MSIPNSLPSAQPPSSSKNEAEDSKLSIEALGQKIIFRQALPECDLDCTNCKKSLCTLKSSGLHVSEKDSLQQLALTFHNLALFVHEKIDTEKDQSSSPHSKKKSPRFSEGLEGSPSENFPKLASLAPKSASSKSIRSSPDGEEASSAASDSRSSRRTRATVSPRVKIPVLPMSSCNKKCETCSQPECTHPPDEPFIRQQ